MSNLVYFFLALAALIVGYMVYGRITEKLFGVDPSRETPAIAMADGVDYIKIPPPKLFLIQLLNIAGVGPVFGPILGALYGPSALIWIVAGSIFAGGVHDYFAGMMSVRYRGASIPDVVGHTLGNVFKQFMRGFSVLLLLLVGVVFVTAPAGLLAQLTPAWMDKSFWVIIIFIYYILATVMPIDVIIGRLYPFFASVLIIMAVGVAGGLIYHGYEFYSWAAWENQHPAQLPLWPLMFITIACGALSGFHATQSPLMSRCLGNEKYGRPVFFGAMIAEGAIALIWATAGMTFYQSAPDLLAVIDSGTPSAVVSQICLTLLGPVGGVLAILGVIVLPITSGDTAFRAARLIIADVTHVSQQKILSRVMVALPLFAMGAVLSQIDFNIIWRYFGWANQTLATIVLWSAAAYAVRRGSFHWLISLPATFMTAVVFSYICIAKEGLQLGYTPSVTIGCIVGAASLMFFLYNLGWFRKNVPLELSYTKKTT